MDKAADKGIPNLGFGIVPLPAAKADEGSRARLELERVKSEAIRSNVKSAMEAADALVSSLERINSLGGEIRLSGEKTDSVLEKLAAGRNTIDSLIAKIKQGVILAACQGHS